MNEFEGTDWIELSAKWNLVENSMVVLAPDEEEEILEKTREIILSTADEAPDIDENVVYDCEEFIRAKIHSEHDSSWDPIWRALLEVKSEWTFLRAFGSLIEHA